MLLDMDTTPSVSVNLAKPRFNRAAIKRHALKVSREARLGKFTRVSEQFIDDVIANVESQIRSMRSRSTISPLGQVDPDEGENFLTGAGYLDLCEAFNICIARTIHCEVNKRRTGKTL